MSTLLSELAIAQGVPPLPHSEQKLSLVTPMVLRNSGRVGSRRFDESLRVSQMIRRLFVFILSFRLGRGENAI